MVLTKPFRGIFRILEYEASLSKTPVVVASLRPPYTACVAHTRRALRKPCNNTSNHSLADKNCRFEQEQGRESHRGLRTTAR